MKLFSLSVRLNIAVGNKQLQGESPEAAALVQQWINFADNEILPSACTWVFPCLGIIQFNKQVTAANVLGIFRACPLV